METVSYQKSIVSHCIVNKIKNMFKIDLIATRASPHESSLLFISEIYEADIAEYNCWVPERQAVSLEVIVKVSYH